MDDITANLEQKRARAQTRVDHLRTARGKALVDGTVFDDAQLQAAERALATIDDQIADATDELDRRDREDAPRRAKLAFDVRMEAYTGALDERLAALAAAEAAFRTYVTLMKRAVDAMEKVRAAAGELNGHLGHDSSAVPAEFSAVNVANRFETYQRAILFGAFGRRFGNLDLGPQPDGPTPTTAWADFERRIGDAREWYARHAPGYATPNEEAA